MADWRRVAWPLQGQPTVVSREGEATFRGTPDDYKLDLNAHLAGPSIPPGRWTVSGRGNQEKMDLSSLRGDVLRGRLAAQGSVTWKPAVTWRVQLNGNGLDPGAQWPEWPGRVAFAATSNGTLRDAGPYGQVDLTKLQGNLRGNPLDGRVHLELMGDRYRLPRLDLRSGSARVTAAGTFSAEAGDLDLEARRPQPGRGPAGQPAAPSSPKAASPAPGRRRGSSPR